VIPANLRYAWHNSGSPWLVRAHVLADAAAALRPSVTVSRGDDLVLAYGGVRHGLTHVLPFLEQRRGTPSRHTTRRTTWRELAAGTAAPEADLLAVGHQRDLPAPRHALAMPFRIVLGVPVGPDPGEVPARLARKARQQHARELRSRARTLEVATGEADFHRFYDEMHRPTMANRHGDALVCLFRRGKLFFLCESGQRVAGMLCRLEGRTLVLRLAGVAEGSEEPYKVGTYMALYVLILQWAAANGLDFVDLSGSEPFLSKGIFQFKRKMRPLVSLPGNHFRHKRLLLHVRRDRPAVRDFLVANPVLTAGFEAVHFHDDDRPPRTDLRWETPGVTGQRLVHLDEFLAGLPAGDAVTVHHGGI
jgi:hypothetical protein